MSEQAARDLLAEVLKITDGCELNEEDLDRWRERAKAFLEQGMTIHLNDVPTRTTAKVLSYDVLLHLRYGDVFPLRGNPMAILIEDSRGRRQLGFGGHVTVEEGMKIRIYDR